MNKLDSEHKSCPKDHFKLYQSARQMMKSRNYQNAISSLENCLNASDCQIDKILKLDMHITIAFSYFYLSKYNESSYNFSQAIDICKSSITQIGKENLNFLR